MCTGHESILHQGGFGESSGSVSLHLEDELNDILGRRECGFKGN